MRTLKKALRLYFASKAIRKQPTYPTAYLCAECRCEYLNRALLEKFRKPYGNRMVNKRIYEKSLDGAKAISFGGAQCGNMTDCLFVEE